MSGTNRLVGVLTLAPDYHVTQSRDLMSQCIAYFTTLIQPNMVIIQNCRFCKGSQIQNNLPNKCKRVQNATFFLEYYFWTRMSLERRPELAIHQRGVPRFCQSSEGWATRFCQILNINKTGIAQIWPHNTYSGVLKKLMYMYVGGPKILSIIGRWIPDFTGKIKILPPPPPVMFSERYLTYEQP